LPGAAPGTWLARWLDACADLADLQVRNPLVDAVVEEVSGRRIRVGDRWLLDFASCNYLGLDLDPEVIGAIPGYLARWGTHPSWSRMLGSPVLYEQIEGRLVELLGVEDALLLPTLTHIHASVVPLLAGAGTILLDARAHKTLYDGCAVARANGARLVGFPHDDPGALEELLRRQPRGPRLICMDGVNSMTATRRGWWSSRPWRARTTPCCTWTTPTASGWSGSAPPTRPPPTGGAATASSATWARPTTTWC